MIFIVIVIKALSFFIKKERYLCTTDESVVTILNYCFERNETIFLDKLFLYLP